MVSKPKGPSKEEQAAAQAVTDRQNDELANLNDEENRRIKKLILGGRGGTRTFRGAAMYRPAPGNSSGGPARAASAAGPASSSASRTFQSAGTRGGRRPGLATN